MGVVVFATIQQDLGGWKVNWVDDGNASSIIASWVGVASICEGILLGHSCSTKEGSVIIDTSADRLGLPSKVLQKGATILTKDAGEFLDEGQEWMASDALRVGA